MKPKLKTFDLQIFAEGEQAQNDASASTGAAASAPIKGDKLVFYYRLLKNEKTKDAMLIGYQTEGGENLSRDSDTTATKSGPIPVPGTLEVELSFTALVEKNRTAEKELKNALYDSEKVEMWLVNLGRPSTEANAENKYDASYYQGIVSQFEKSADADDFATYATTFKGEGKPQDGYVTVTKEEEEALAYAFRDLAKVVEQGA